MAALVLIASFSVLIGAFCIVRLAGFDHQILYEKDPFPETKVYDPFGDLERAGKPGPFSKPPKNPECSETDAEDGPIAVPMNGPDSPIDEFLISNYHHYEIVSRFAS